MKQFAFTIADACQHAHLTCLGNSGQGFTMAEILLSLTIIGVVAAITLPSLTGNINERTWNTQRKALYARLSQAISLMPSLNGYGTLVEGNDSTSAQDTATETFLTDGLSKVLKINNICDNEHLEDCGIVTSFTDMNGSKKNIPTTLYELSDYFRSVTYFNSSYSTKNTKAAAFETQNGESLIVFYNQTCKTEYINEENPNSYGDLYGFPQATMCLNFIYDLNGNKGPNTIGKDMGIMTAFNSIDSRVVAPVPSSNTNAGGSTATYKWQEAAKACTTQDNETRIPNIDELSSILINDYIFDLTGSSCYWASSVFDSQRAWNVSTQYGFRGTCAKSYARYVRCIKR